MKTETIRYFAYSIMFLILTLTALYISNLVKVDVSYELDFIIIAGISLEGFLYWLEKGQNTLKSKLPTP